MDSSEFAVDDIIQENDQTYNDINVPQSTSGIIDITEEQNQMRKRFYQINLLILMKLALIYFI